MLYFKTACVRKALYVIAMFLLPLAAFAQSAKVSISGSDITVKQAFDIIEQQTNYSFAYNVSAFDISRKVSLELTDATLESALADILNGSGYTYNITANHILIMPGVLPVVENTVVPVSLQTPPTRETELVAASTDDVTEMVITEPVTIDVPAAVTDGINTVNNPSTLKVPSLSISKGFYSGLDAIVPQPVKHHPAFAIKTNVLSDLTTTFNLGVEMSTGKKTTVSLNGSYNPWKFGDREENKKIRHWVIKPELRVWTNEAYDGSFFGFHGFFTHYNAGGIKLPLGIFSDLETNRYDGWGAGAGVTYGYQWYLGSHWNLEASFGFGYSYMKYDRYDCIRCGDMKESTTKHYFGPTNIGISFVYMIKSKK